MKNLMHFFTIFANIVAIFGAPLNISRHLEEDAVLSTPELIVKYGYPVEIHHVITEDGYILEMHRIPHGVAKGAGPRKHKPVVLVMHGVLSSSADWIIIGPSDGLGYLLADHGYDVWLGNARGNTYSRKHVTLKPGDAKFWDFSWHEIGIYDLPTMIDYVLKITGKEKIFYIAHSQGGTSFWVMCSMKPEYNDKILQFFGMGPAAYLTHMKSSLLRLIIHYYNQVVLLLKLIGANEFLPSTELLTEAGALFCKNTDLSQFICTNSMFVFVGFDENELRTDLLPIIVAHSPAGASTRQVLHYAQLSMTNEKFRQYDFGEAENLVRYNSTTPPDYDLSKVTTPVTFFSSKNDYVADDFDTRTLYDELKNKNGYFQVDSFNHNDYLYGKHVKSLVYDKIIDLLSKYLENNK